MIWSIFSNINYSIPPQRTDVFEVRFSRYRPSLFCFCRMQYFVLYPRLCTSTCTKNFVDASLYVHTGCLQYANTIYLYVETKILALRAINIRWISLLNRKAIIEQDICYRIQIPCFFLSIYVVLTGFYISTFSPLINPPSLTPHPFKGNFLVFKKGHINNPPF